MTAFLSFPGLSLESFFFFFKIYLLIWERERMCKQAEGEGETLKQTPCWAWSPNAGPDPMTLRSWSELKSRVGCSADWATQAPQVQNLLTWVISLCLSWVLRNLACTSLLITFHFLAEDPIGLPQSGYTLACPRAFAFVLSSASIALSPPLPQLASSSFFRTYLNVTSSEKPFPDFPNQVPRCTKPLVSFMFYNDQFECLVLTVSFIRVGATSISFPVVSEPNLACRMCSINTYWMNEWYRGEMTREGVIWFFLKDFIYLREWAWDRAWAKAEGEADSSADEGTRCRARSQDPGIMTQAQARCLTEPPRWPWFGFWC